MIVWALSGLSTAKAMEADVLFDQVSPSVWVVHSFDAQGKPLALGTAVVVGAGRLITNCHVLVKASSFTVQHANVIYLGTLEFPDVERDLCQLKVNNFIAPAVRIGQIDQLRVGQKVFAIGAPRGLEQTLSDGLLSALRLGSDGKLRYIQTSAPISHGSSGGGLFNNKGELIGITTLAAEAAYAQNISFAVPAQWIREVPERGKAAMEKSRALSSQAVSLSRIQPSTVQPPARQSPTTPSPTAPSYVEQPPAEQLPVTPPSGLPVQIAQLNRGCQSSYQRFLTMPLPRSFVISTNGHCGYSWSSKEVIAAQIAPQIRAIASCQRVGGENCHVYMNDTVVLDGPT